MSITIYSKSACSQCDQAKMLLSMKGIDFTVKMLNVDYTLEELKDLVPTARAFPIIFEDDNYVGTLSDLKQYVNK